MQSLRVKMNLVFMTIKSVLQSAEITRNATAACPRGVTVKAMDYGIVVSEFVFQSCYYVHFWANTHVKGMNRLILPAMG